MQPAAFLAKKGAVGQLKGVADSQSESQLSTETGLGHEELPLIRWLDNNETSCFKLLALYTPPPAPPRLVLLDSPRHASHRPAPQNIVHLSYTADDEKLVFPQLEDNESNGMGVRSLPKINIKKRKKPTPLPF